MIALYHPYIESIVYASPAYVEALALRERVLRIPIGKTFQRREIEEEWQQHHFGYRAAHSAVLIGVCVLKIVNASCLQLRQMAVDESSRQRGVGTNLVLHCIKWAKTMGYRRIRLDARHHAVAFYAKLGFELKGGAFEHLGIRHYTMYMDL